jgi:hypothetical protein
MPQGKFLRQLAMGLFGGKVSHALAAVAAPRLRVEDKENNKLKSVQTAQNNVACTVTGHKRSDHVTVADLLTMAHMQSLNCMVITAVALEMWSAFHSSDGIDGARNPLGVAIFGNDNTRETWASRAGHTHIALRGENTLALHGGRIWNKSPALRLALTRHKTKWAGKAIARAAPL